MSLEHSPARRERRAIPPAAYSVPEFCEAHRISRSLFYLSLQEGWGPTVMKAGARTLVTVESAAAWRKAREEATGQGPNTGAS